MNVPTLWKTISRTCYQALTKIPKQNYEINSSARSMHCVCSNKSFLLSARTIPSAIPAQSSDLLRVTLPSIIPNCGMKIRGKPKLRCKDCYYVVREERLYVMCKSKPRHKQMSMKKKEHNTWMLSHATQSREREW